MGQIHFPQGVNSPGQLGLSWATFFDDFMGSSLGTTADVSTWDTTVAGTATVTLPDTGTTGEALLFGTAATDIASMQPNGMGVTFQPGKKAIFECRCKVSGITTDTDELFGLATVSALPLLTTGLPLNGNFAGFVKTGATANIDIITQTATASKTTTPAAGTFVADTYKVFRIEWDGVDKVRYSIDGALVATHTANIPASTVLLQPTFALQTIDAGAADYSFTIDYVLATAQR